MARKLIASATVAAMVIAYLTIPSFEASQHRPDPHTAPGASPSQVYSFGVPGGQGKVLQLEHKTPTLVSGVTGTVVQVATSNSNGYALTSNGDVWAWGAGEEFELGTGNIESFASNAVKVHFPGGVKISFLSDPMPYDGGFAVDSHGNAWAWGYNSTSQFCVPNTRLLHRPVRLPLSHVTLATGAGGHMIFDSNGTVYGCGSNSRGELGDGSTKERRTPTPVVGLPNGAVKALVSSFAGSGALMDSGAYYNWGLNTAGQLGNGNTVNSSVPVHVSLPALVTQVAQGASTKTNGQTIVLLANNSVWSWGSGQYGQLGVGTRGNSSVPVQVNVSAGVRFVHLASGGFSCYAIDSTGKLWAWGRNQYGQLGIGGSSLIQVRPVAVGITLTRVSTTATNVAAFYQH